MPTIRDLRALFAEASPGEHYYLRCCDGHCSGTELVWLPEAKRWIYCDLDAGRIGAADSLTLIVSDADGDESGLNTLGDWVGCDFGGGPGLWVLDADLPADFDLPEDAQVFEVGDPAEGLVPVELIEDA